MECWKERKVNENEVERVLTSVRKNVMRESKRRRIDQALHHILKMEKK